MKKIFLLLWFVLLGLFEVQAYQFEKNGIYYDIVNGKAVVVSGGSVMYSGDVVIPETVEYGGQHYVVDSIGEWAFNACSGLMSVKLPEKLRAIGSLAFTDCYGLTSISFPASLKVIGYGAFQNCDGLTSLSFPEGMTQIGDGAFQRCGRLETLFFPSTMKSIDWGVFCESHENEYGGECTCDSIRRIEVKGIATWFNSDRFTERNYHVAAPYADLYVNGELLTEVVLPDTMTRIRPALFYGCKKLRSVVFPNNLKVIDDCAFTICNQLKEVSFQEGLERIGGIAFSDCALHDTIVFPQTLKYISGSAFANNICLSVVRFPIGLEYIDSYAFSNCNALSEIRFPASVLSVGNDAFGYCHSIKDVYTYIIDPLQLDQTTFSAEVFKNATLHVPETAQNNYYWDTQWSQFPSIVMFNEPYEYFYLNKDLVIDEETPRLEGDTIPGTGEVQGPDADLNPGSGLVVEGSESQDLGDVHLKDDGNGNGASVIGQGNKDGHCNINAKNLHIDIQVEANRWYFFYFPYPIDKKNIKYAGSYVLRWYDGAERAQHGRGGWKDWTADKLTAGVGYIFQGSQSGTLTFKIPDAKFDGENRDILLQSHGADEVQDAGWNFVGNPYTSYFNLQDLGYDYPVTIWNGWSYEAYNPQDDDYVLYPYQAFFVQKPNAEDGITFHAAHRKTKLQSEAARRANVAPRWMRRAAGVERRLVNLTLSDGKVTDKTRVVFNARKREAYEVGCDAAKFMAEGVPQLYSLDGQGVKYAINERPEGNGVVSLGYEVQAAGNYTIGLTRADVGVMLKDKLTGASHDFSEGDYMFSSEAGTFHDRFLLVKSASATGVNGVFAAGEAVVDVENGTIAVSGADGLRTTVTALSGILMGTINGNGCLDVRPGVYVVNVGGQARKVVVR